jgi:hypothetical protein
VCSSRLLFTQTNKQPKPKNMPHHLPPSPNSNNNNNNPLSSSSLTPLNIPPIIETVPSIIITNNNNPNNNNHHYLRRRQSTNSYYDQLMSSPRGSGQFEILYSYETNDIPSQLIAMLNVASQRWGKIVKTRHTPLAGLGTRVVCGKQRTIPDFNDMLVFVNVQVNDGSGGTLASATPCLGFENFARVGEMLLDKDDVTIFLKNHPDVLLNVIIHELGHILGIGTMWDTFNLVGGTSDDPNYLGSNGNGALNYVNNTSGIPFVKIETLGGVGTARAHWREQTYGDELMTGFLGLKEQPLSLISIQSLVDLKYQVDSSAADVYSIPINGWNESDIFINISPQNTPTVSKNDFTLPPGFSGIASAADSGVLWIAIVASVCGLALILLAMSFLRKRKTHWSAMYVGGGPALLDQQGSTANTNNSSSMVGNNKGDVSTFNYQQSNNNANDNIIPLFVDETSNNNNNEKEWCCPNCTLTTIGSRCEACTTHRVVMIDSIHDKKTLIVNGMLNV